MITHYVGEQLALEQELDATVALDLGVDQFSDETQAPRRFDLGVASRILEIRYGGRGSQDAVPAVPATKEEDAKPGKPAVKVGLIEEIKHEHLQADGVRIQNPGKSQQGQS